jgi:hypothetical protein
MLTLNRETASINSNAYASLSYNSHSPAEKSDSQLTSLNQLHNLANAASAVLSESSGDVEPASYISNNSSTNSSSSSSDFQMGSLCSSISCFASESQTNSISGARFNSNSTFNLRDEQEQESYSNYTRSDISEFKQEYGSGNDRCFSVQRSNASNNLTPYNQQSIYDPRALHNKNIIESCYSFSSQQKQLEKNNDSSHLKSNYLLKGFYFIFLIHICLLVFFTVVAVIIKAESKLFSHNQRNNVVNSDRDNSSNANHVNSSVLLAKSSFSNSTHHSQHSHSTRVKELENTNLEHKRKQNYLTV